MEKGLLRRARGRGIAWAAALLACFPTVLARGQALTPGEAVRIAVEQNHGVRLARLQARTGELLNSAGNAGMLPTVDAVGSYAVNNAATKQTFFSGDVREADNADSRAIAGAVQLNWTVFDGLAMFAAKDRLQAIEELSRTQLRERIEATVYAVLSAYYQLGQLRRAIAVQQEGVRISRERLAIASIGARIGSMSGLDLVQARLDLSADSAAVLGLMVQASAAATRLNALMGRDPGTPLELAQEVPAAEALDLAQVQQQARQANSALQQARQQRIAADGSMKELRGALMPRVDLFANYGYAKSTSAVGFLQSNQALGPDYGARVSVPLFRGAQMRRAAQAAKLASEGAAVAEQQAALDLEAAILDAWSAYTAAQQRVALEEENLGGARTQADAALAGYRTGSISAVQLRDVQLGLIAAEQRLLVARYGAKLGELQLKWLAGRLEGAVE